MYCLQWLLPFLIIPKHILHPTFLVDQALFFWFYLIGFFLERRPCFSCTLLFLVAVGFICYSDGDQSIFWPSCETVLNGEMCKFVYDIKQHNEFRL
uniref:Bladder cancer-associated protein n=1 Tax=Acrobeloides nanus TaxID=290746 RepID=A0A914BZX3_9BILA